ncbi:unnamed protein product, partial [Hydatigera taeniaeformis]|uniref:CFA47 protein n=1 Tax=Hydatigena taeniaeformis TaxID=6205 RepID=A0A0R3WUE4_HYDTA
YEVESQALIAKLPVVARAYGSPVEFLTAIKSINTKAFNDCLMSKVTDVRFSELILSSIPARETTISFGAVSSITEIKKREVKLKNNSSFKAKPFISLLLRPHEGYAVSRSHATARKLIEPMGRNKSGFSLSPLQFIIPPHGEASTFVTLDGCIASLQNVPKIEAYAQGFITIEEVGESARLPESLFLPQLRLNLKATAMTPMWVSK